MKVVAYQVADHIDIKQFKQAFTAELTHSDSDELFYTIEKGKYLYVFKYGVACLMNHTEVETTGVLKMVMDYCRNPLQDRFKDAFDIAQDTGKLVFGYNQVSIPGNDPEMLRLIMLNLSQSVALDYYEQQTNLLLEETNHHTQTLEQKGKLEMSGKALKQYIGKTLNLKNKIAENLYIFDSPEETWENEQLSKVDTGMKKTFDLQSRFRTIQEGLGIVKENLELFKDLLQYRHSTYLEWIVIILILTEVINLMIEKFFSH